jgi:hypothetical protein
MGLLTNKMHEASFMVKITSVDLKLQFQKVSVQTFFPG